MTGPGKLTARHEVADADAGMRVDAFLARQLEGVSRSRVQSLIRDGHVSCRGRTIGDANERVKPGEEFVVVLPPPVAATPKGQDITLAVVFEDEHLIVVDKPAGLVVHPAAGHADGTLVNALIQHCGDSLSGIGGVRRPGIVHRLDKDTSGLLVVAKSDAAHAGLADQFAAHGRDGRLVRAYEGVCWRVPDRMVGTVDAPLARSSQNRTKISVVRSERGREAVTHYEVLEVFGGSGAGAIAPTRSDVRSAASRRVTGAMARRPDEPPVAARLRLVLETGRTHQIRVHLAHIGHPLLGDATYAAGFKASAKRLAPAQSAALGRLRRQALHAAELGFEHPVTGERLHFESALPADMKALIEALRALG
ncbi:MAG: RNA pseudouridine synthase [Hyphomicrobiaceae bacterium]|nr:RNA pseudouridine synthase [Hyphomicrobiaceae bacterium]